jgi:signal transduction histidine kinase
LRFLFAPRSKAFDRNIIAAHRSRRSSDSRRARIPPPGMSGTTVNARLTPALRTLPRATGGHPGRPMRCIKPIVNIGHYSAVVITILPPLSSRKARSLSTLLSAITVLLVAIVASVCGLSAMDAYRHQQQADRALSATMVARQILTAKVALRIELGLTESALTAVTPMSATTEKELVTLHARTAAALDAAAGKLDQFGAPQTAGTRAQMHKTIAHYKNLARDTLVALRAPQLQRPQNLIRDWQTTSVLLTAEINAQAEALSQKIAGADPFVDEMIKINNTIWRLRRDAGNDRGRIQNAIARNRLPPAGDMRADSELMGRIDARWSDLLDDSRMHTTPPQLQSAIQNAQKVYFTDYRSLRQHVYLVLENNLMPLLTEREWFERSNVALASITNIGNIALELTADHAAAQARAAQHNLYGALAVMLAALFSAILAAAYVAQRVIWPLKRITNTMRVIAEGDLGEPIPFRNRHDEIGQFAQALQMFRDAELERERLKTALLENQGAKEAAELLNRQKSEFLANMSHELRTPLNAVIGFSEIIATEALGPGSPRYREYAKDICGAGTHLLSLINDILDLSKVEAGKLDLHCEPINLADLINECAHLMQERTVRQGLHIALDVAALPSLLLDRLRVKQILLNLLSNAIKFTPRGGSVRIEAGRDASGRIVVHIRDTGIGIAPEMTALVFEPFRQVDSALSRKFEGTGLGLSLVKRLMELHGGDVYIESALHEGTCVFLSFPASRIAHGAAYGSGDAPAASAQQ